LGINELLSRLQILMKLDIQHFYYTRIIMWNFTNFNSVTVSLYLRALLDFYIYFLSFNRFWWKTTYSTSVICILPCASFIQFRSLWTPFLLGT